MATFGIILLILVLVVIMYALMMNKGGSCCGGRGHGDQPSGGPGSCSMNASSCTREGPEKDGADLDPVCGMAVGPNGPITSEHRGRRYRFCSEYCRQGFVDNPDKYL